MSPMPTAGAYMIPLKEYPTIHENENINNAIRILKENLHKNNSPWQGHRLVIALNDHSEPVGILTLKCLLKAICLRLMEEDTSFKGESVSWYFIEQMRAKGKVTVREVMRPLAQFSLDYNNSVFKAARIFIRQGINYLPIKDGQKVVGILNSRELFFKYYETTRFKAMHRHWLGNNSSVSAFFKKSALRLIGN